MDREALKPGQQVRYVTERCVPQLVAHNGAPALELIEISPGVALQQDILSQMDFVPPVSAQLRLMDATLFNADLFGLRERLLQHQR